MIQIDEKTCRGCGTCIEACPFGVIAMVKDKAVVKNPSACHDCGACIQVCPEKAIKFRGG